MIVARPERYEIKMVMGSNRVLIEDQEGRRHQTIAVSPDCCPITEENFQYTFEHLVLAMRQTGRFPEKCEVACITFPVGTRIMFPPIHVM